MPRIDSIQIRKRYAQCTPRNFESAGLDIEDGETGTKGSRTLELSE